MPIPEDFASHDFLVQDAKNQATKYGFMAFVCNENAKDDNETGTGLRKKLQEIYDTHRMDNNLMDFLGKPLLQSIADILAFKPAASSGGAVAGSAASTPPAKRRRR